MADIVISSYKEYDPEVLRRLQMAELEILLAVDRVCRENDIAYFLDSGTVLGAKRHQGFIPWDDDMDLGMLRPDYDRFISIAQEALGDRFVVSTPSTNESQAAMFGKVWLADTIFETQEIIDAGFETGIYVDIFPYDVLNRDPKIAKKQIAIGNLWQKIAYLYHSPHLSVSMEGFKGKLFELACMASHGALRLLVNQKKIVEHFDKACELGKDDPSDEYVLLSYPMKQSFPKVMFLPTSKVVFEGHEMPAVNDLETYLEIVYGSDWRELPSPEQRRNHAPLNLVFENEQCKDR